MRTPLLALCALLLPALVAAPASGSLLPAACFRYDTATQVVDAGDVSLHANAWGGHLLEYPGIAGETRYYVSDYNYVFLFSFWFYVETNGIPGLQREDDACRDCPQSDCGDVWTDFLV